MSQNQEELFSELFAYRVVLQDSYENESDIIRELKNYLRDQNLISSVNIPNILHEFYKIYGIEIPLDTIIQACNNLVVNNMLGFMLSHGDFEYAHEHDYEHNHEHNHEHNNDNEEEIEEDAADDANSDPDDADDADPDVDPDADPNANNEHVQMISGNQFINMLAQAIFQQHQNGYPINGLLQQLSSNSTVHNGSNIQTQTQTNPNTFTNPTNTNTNIQNEELHEIHNIEELQESISHSDISGDELSDSEILNNSSSSPNLQQIASDMLSMNNSPNVLNSMLQFTSLSPGSIHGSIHHGLIHHSGVFNIPNHHSRQTTINSTINSTGPTSNPWANQSISHSSLVSALNNLLSGLQGPTGSISINNNINMGQPFQNVVVSMDDNDIEKLKSTKLEASLDTDCSVCMGHMERDEIVTELVCSHTFHTECIQPYLKQYNYKCPICRAEVGKAKYNL